MLFSIHLPAQITPGCTDPVASNYNPLANQNDGSCLYAAATVSSLASWQLDQALTEISGLIHDGGRLLGQQDEIDTRLFELDTLNGNIVQTYSCSGVSNYNWEEIAQDSQYIYIGDFGNNINGNRTDLRIYRVDKSSLNNGNTVVDTIGFSYSDQVNFAPTGINNTDFDCEAFVVTNDSIFLFTKRWISGGTTLYGLPKTPGQHLAMPIDSFNSQGYITGATQLHGTQLVMLCGYNNFLQPFLYLLYDYPNNAFFKGNRRRLGINLPFHQIEGIATRNGLKVYLANEAFSSSFTSVAQQLHTIDLTMFLNHFLNPVTTGQPEYDSNLPALYPNPTNQSITLCNADNFRGKRYLIRDCMGRVVSHGIFTGTIDVSTFGQGVYLLQLEDMPTKRFTIERLVPIQ